MSREKKRRYFRSIELIKEKGIAPEEAMLESGFEKALKIRPRKKPLGMKKRKMTQG